MVCSHKSQDTKAPIIRTLSRDDHARWDKYLRDVPYGTFSQQIEWATVVEKIYGHQPIYLMALYEEEVCGILPMFLVRRPFLKPILASDIFTSYGGVCADSPDVEQALMEEAARLAVQHDVSYLEIKNTKKIAGLGRPWHRKTDYCTMVVDLRAGTDVIWKGWHKRTRNNIRKASKQGIHLKQGPHLLDDFYRLVLINMKRLGTPVHSKEFYANILTAFGPAATLFVVEREGEAFAGALTVAFRNSLQVLVGASLPHLWKLKPNDYLYWEVMQYARNQGFDYLDFGRSTWNSGTFEFKKHMSAKPAPLYYDYYLNRGTAVPNISQDNKQYWLLIQTWRLLPLHLTRALGPHLIKYVV